MNTYKDILIDLHEQEKKEFGEGFLYEGAENNELEDFVKRVTKNLNFALDKGYLDFLSFTNGLDYDGLVIYGINRYQDENVFIEGFVEANQEYRQELALLDYIFYGDENTTRQVFNIKTKRFEIIDRVSWDVISYHDCFDEMLLTAIEQL